MVSKLYTLQSSPCGEHWVSQAPSPRCLGDCGLAVFMWPWVGVPMPRMKLCYITRGSVFAPCWLWVHLVSKGVGTSHSTTSGCTWITLPWNKGMSDAPTTPRIFFPLPECRVNPPGLEWLQDIPPDISRTDVAPCIVITVYGLYSLCGTLLSFPE